MIYLFDKDEKLIKVVRKPAIKTALQKYSLTKERYVSDRLTVEMKALNDDELEKVEYMAIQTMEDAHAFHYFYIAQKSSDQLTTLIGVQSGIEELRKSPVFDKRPQNALAREVINDLLSGTNWQARFVGETTPHSTNFYYISVFDALKKVCEVWDLEMQFFVEMNGNRIGARYIDFKRKIGQAVGKRVVYGHNALQILQEVERTNIFTALIGRGKGEQVSSAEESGKQANVFGRKITFEDVVWSTASGKPVNKPKGQKYVELPAMTKLYGIKNADGSMRPKIGFVDFQEEEDPGKLIERTYKALVDAARPQLALKTSSVYLRGAKIGDTIRVVRHDKRLDYDTRIFDITFNRLNDQSSDIKLGDRIGETNEAKAQTIADKAIDEFVANEFTNFVKNLPDYLPTADGFNNNWYGAEDPTREHPGKVLINDIWYKPDPEHEGHKIMLRWTGEVWEELLRTFSSEALRAKISDEIEKLNKAMKASDLALKEQTTQVLRTASANASAIEAAKGAITKLNQDLAGARQTNQAAIDRLKSDFANAQKAASDQTALLKSDLANIRTKQSQTETEIGKQLSALNATKTELAGVKTAQANYEQTTTRRLAELANVADGKANKAELVQTAEELKSRIASVQASGRNLFLNSLFKQDIRKTGIWTTSTYTATIDSESKYLGHNALKIIGQDPAGKDGGNPKITYPATGQYGKVVPGSMTNQEVIISFYAKAENAGTILRSRLGNIWFKDGNVTLTTEVKRYVVKFSMAWTGLSNLTTNEWLFNLNRADTVWIWMPKFEVSDTDTPYLEASEDVEGLITAVESSFKQRADSLEAGVNRLTEGLKTKADSSALTVLSDRILASVKSLETDTQNQLNQKLSTTEFDVRASGIRQEIVNATKDKADKTLVTAEAGKLREELASLSVGENLFINSEFKNLRDNNQRYTANGRTYQNMIAPYWYNPYNAGLPNAQNIQHGYFDTETFSDTVFAFNESDGSRHWKALSTDFKIGVIAAGEYYFSADLYAADLGTYIVVGFYYHDASGRMNFYSGRKRIDVTEKGRWVRLGAPLKVNDDIDLTKKVQFYIYGYNFSTNSILYLKKPKVSKGRLKSDWSPALEDTEGLITEAKAVFERTAQGLRVDLSAVQAYVAADGTRSEALRTYSREETARQLTALRQSVESGYVAKAQHTEDVRGLTRRFEELTVGGRNLALGTRKEWSTPFTNFSGNANVCPPLYKVLTDGLQVGDTLRSKVILKYTDVRPSAGKTATVWLQGNGNVTGWTAGSYNGSPAKTLSGSGEITFEHSFKITENHLKNAYWNWMFRTDFIASGSLQWRLAKVESGSVFTSWSPAPEDSTSYADTKLAEFRQGIDGQLANVQSALNTANGSLTNFNTWKQSAQETLNKVGRVETGLNETKTSLAEFRRTAEGQLTTITQQVAGKASQTDFQRVQETSKLYERLIGSTEKEVVDKVSRMALTNELFQVEVSKNLGLRTVQYQIANAWAVQNLNSNGDIISQINATGPNVRIQGESIHLDGKALIDNGIIKNAMIESMLADKITAGTLNAANVNIVNLNANKIVGLDANFIKSKIELAFIEWMKGKTISAQNDAMQINLNDGHVLFYNDDASIKRVAAGYPTQFIRYENKQENGQNHGRTIIGSNRNGTNAWKSVSFAGLVIDNNSNNSVDKIYQFGDYNHMRHAQGDDGWNFSVVTQTMTPGVWNKNSEVWARHFVVPRNTKGDTDSPTQFIRLEESVAAIWNILNHAASGQVTMTQAMKNLINSRKAAWDIVRNVG
jgi:phage minor structural protein